MRLYDLSKIDLGSPDVAIVGMAARLPGAADVFEFWSNLYGGVESIRDLSDEELRQAGVDQATLQDPNYVRRAARLDRLELFDAAFFGFSKREASVLDPQHRHFLEVCFEALESAGIAPEAFGGPIGVFAGSGMNAYMPYNLFTNPELMRSMGLFLARHTGNDKDFLSTRVSYCLNLTGPSLNVQTACSTSLVAIHLACQSLLAGECDAALAGGVTIELPHYRGYRYEEGEILSPDGSCRPFEARSKGTVFGSGAGVVVLKRLRDALDAGDHIHALIKGTAINNDGDRKVGYLAPSVPGQAECVVEALQVAGLTGRDLSYVECHGTGTPVGDPIEIAALTQAFGRSTDERAFCGVGSVKSNIGHLDTAAGVASLIKVAQMLEHESLVPTLHFERPNPQIDFPSTPFFAVGEKRAWARGPNPRRAGVSSLGVGGTNAHVVLEEAPPRLPRKPVQRPPLFVLSARSRGSLDAASLRLARHLHETPDIDLELVSATLLRGRRRFPFSRVVVARSSSELAALLEKPDAARVFDVAGSQPGCPVVFMFPGGGAQHVNMARQVYESEPTVRKVMDQCFDIAQQRFELPLRALIFPEPGDEVAAARELERPSRALPALLSVEIAFARLLLELGVEPVAMIGHSLGEYAAAHLAGVLDLQQALGIVHCRGQLFETVQPGGMLSVPVDSNEIEPLLGHGLSIAAVNAPGMCVVSGDNASLAELESALAARDIAARRLHIEVPAHSPLLEPILGAFRDYLQQIKLGAPARAYASNLTGGMITPQDLSSEYFVRHLRSTVRFSDGIEALLALHPNAMFVEVGPGQTLSALTRLHPARKPQSGIVPCAPHVKDQSDGALFLRASLGRIHAHGGSVNLDALGVGRGVVPLPPTPFEHERHWVAPGHGYFMSSAEVVSATREDDVGRWFFHPAFREEARAAAQDAAGVCWIFADRELGQSLSLEAAARGATPVLIVPSDASRRVGPGQLELRLSEPEDYDELLGKAILEHGTPRRILHALALSEPALAEGATPSDGLLDRVFYSLLYLAQLLSREELAPRVDLSIAVAAAFDVVGAETRRPLHALAQGPCLVVPREIPELRARLHDIGEPIDRERVARTLLDELLVETSRSFVAERAGLRFVDTLERVTLDRQEPLALSPQPVVLLTGGLGGIARTLAQHFVRTRDARIVLVSRSSFPDPSSWAQARADAQDGSLLAEQLDDLLMLRAAGTQFSIEQADVTSEAQVQSLLERVRARFGGIDVVVHAAGTLDDTPLATKDRSAARAVLAPKLDGTVSLLRQLQPAPPRLLLLLASTSAVLGPPGQIDYTAANAVVAALARFAGPQLPKTRVVSLGFGVWRDTGMAARALKGGTPDLRGEATGHPLLERVERGAAGETRFESSYDPAKQWILDEHRVRGQGAVLPGTGSVEIVRAAGSLALGVPSDAGVMLSDIVFLSPLDVVDGEPRLVRVLVSIDATQPGLARVLLSSRRAGDPSEVEHARGTLQRLQAAQPARLELAEIFGRCNLRSETFEPGRQVLPQDRQLAFGPRFRVLQSMRYGEREAVAELALGPSYSADLELYRLHPALLDIASGFAFSLADVTLDVSRVRVPLSYQHLRMYAPLTASIVSHVRLRSASNDGLAVFDLTITDRDGRVLLEVEGYTTKAVQPSTLSSTQQTLRKTSLLERWSTQGITREEGAEVVERLLVHACPAEIYASPTSLYELLAELGAGSLQGQSADAPGPVSLRPSSAPADAPRDDVERRLADWWRSLLGVDSVGIRDNFFDLGGHSLIAVRLFARIKKAYGVDLPLAVLFQAPTIESCATVLRQELGITLNVDAESEPSHGSAPQASRPERAFDHLVTIQRGNGGMPFFCVHGAGGNVLNFRDLARNLGSDQPFIGIQARGVNGEPPASSIEEMVSLYHREIREAYPEGPFYLGGYSGGGVVAFELAQRLREEGKQVPLLVLLDTFHPHTAPRKLSLRERMSKLLEEGPGYISRLGMGRVARHYEELSIELKIRLLESNDLPLPVELREIQMTRSFQSAAARYHARRYDGRVLLFRAQMLADPYKHVGPMLGWQNLLPNLEIVEVPGGHDSLVLEPNVQILARHLTRALLS
ncbi:MAG TPA: SDR family NAD(P)-dependent oxidoreductase [Polyangiaceae bacterium]|nr:SDR family NAD(P)-dependent oxidoreductase [Polyangiaceae bacterium]